MHYSLIKCRLISAFAFSIGGRAVHNNVITKLGQLWSNCLMMVMMMMMTRYILSLYCMHSTHLPDNNWVIRDVWWWLCDEMIRNKHANKQTNTYCSNDDPARHCWSYVCVWESFKGQKGCFISLKRRPVYWKLEMERSMHAARHLSVCHCFAGSELAICSFGSKRIIRKVWLTR